MIFSCKNCGKTYQVDYDNVIEKVIYKDGKASCQCGCALFKKKEPIIRVGFTIDGILDGYGGFLENADYAKARTFIKEMAHSFLRLKFLGCEIYVITEKTENYGYIVREKLCKNRVIFDDIVFTDDESKSDVVNSLKLDIFCYDNCKYIKDLSLDCLNTKLIQLSGSGSILHAMDIAFSGYKEHGNMIKIELSLENPQTICADSSCCTCVGMWDCPSDKIVAVSFGKECQLYRNIG